MMFLSNSIKECLCNTKFYLESLENHSDSLNSNVCDYIELTDCKDISMSWNDLSVMELNVHGFVNKQTDIYLMLKSFTQMENNCLPTITRPTSVTNTSATLLDNIILSVNLYSKHSCSVVINDISDHFPCFSIIKDCRHEEGSTKSLKRKLTEKNISKIKEILSSVNWSALLLDKTADDSMVIFYYKLTETLDKVAPEKMVRY